MDLTLDSEFPQRHTQCKWSIWRFGCKGRSAKVAVIDTGVDIDWIHQTYPFLPLDNIHALDFTTAKQGAEDCPGMDHHGSKVIAAILTGAPEAEIFSLRVYSEGVETTRERFCDALTWCVNSGISIVNISQGFYFGCSSDEPCMLCRKINTYTLTADLFAVISCGDPYTLNEQIERGLSPAICPALNSRLAWGLGGSIIIGDRRTNLDRLVGSDEGLSFVAADFTGGVALLRSRQPTNDVFSVRRAIRRTCAPLVGPPATDLAVGRHCFLLAFLYLEGRRFAPNGPASKQLAELKRPARSAVDTFHAESFKYLMRIVIRLIAKHDWSAAVKDTSDLFETVRSWAEPGHQSIILHVLATCFEALGETNRAAESYRESDRLLDADT
ncbi:MAG TPA: S8 family serine peptidase [Acidobacteriaceae bacterium]|nr:S8 family serine peptidase [Acidobacteriaceae bacterium]